MKRGRLDISTWVSRVFYWDGLLPIGIIVLTWGFSLLDLRNNDWFGFLLVGFFVLTICIRLYSGHRIIARNHLTPQEQQGQRFFLLFGAVFLSLIEMAFFVAAVHPLQAPNQKEAQEIKIIGFLYLAYLVCVTIAMYPGRAPRLQDDPESLSYERNSESPR